MWEVTFSRLDSDLPPRVFPVTNGSYFPDRDPRSSGVKEVA